MLLLKGKLKVYAKSNHFQHNTATIQKEIYTEHYNIVSTLRPSQLVQARSLTEVKCQQQAVVYE